MSEEERSEEGLSEGELQVGEAPAVALSGYYSDADTSLLTPRQRLTWRVGDAMREMIDRLVDNRAPDEAFAAMADDLEAMVETLRGFEHGRRYVQFAEASTAGAGPPKGHAEYSPLIGRANPIAPLMNFTIDPPKVRAEVRFGSAYEGPPGNVHGGLVAAAFDEVMGAAQALTGNPGMTGSLTINYRSPTPLHELLVCEAWTARTEGRKIFVDATLHAGDRLCAEATGLFISVDFAKLAAMMAARNNET
ncbi:MAG: PaaI family thioesterase [Acidimicrobiales bacterium]